MVRSKRQPRYMYEQSLQFGVRIFLNEIFQYNITSTPCLVDDIYFGNIFGVDPRQIRRWRKELKDKNFMYEKKNEQGEKCMYAIFDIEKHDNSPEMKVNFITADKTVLSNKAEAYTYFSEMVQKESQLPQQNLAQINHFFNVFVNIIFDEQYYGLNINNFTTSQDFFQYLVEHLKVDGDIYRKAYLIFLRNYLKITHLPLYLLTTLINLYKNDYLMCKVRPDYLEYRAKQQREIEKFIREQDGLGE